MTKNRYTAAKAAVASGAVVVAGAANAAVDAGVTTALTNAAVDVAAVGGLAFLVFLAAKVYRYFRPAT